MADFDIAVDIVLEQEGGYADHSSDKGNATHYGVSLSFLKGTGVLGDIDNDGDIDIQDVKKLQLKDAKRLYKKYFWRKLKEINSQLIANYIFSMSVNCGNRRSGIIIQTTLNRYRVSSVVLVDGIIGSNTIKAINDVQNIPLFLSLLTLNLIDFYRSIVNKHRDQAVFLLGWLNRAFDCLEDN